MARNMQGMKNRGKILQAMARRRPESSSFLSLAQIWLHQTPIFKIPKVSLESTSFGPITIRNVFMSEQLTSIVSRAKDAWQNANENDLRMELAGDNIYVGLKQEASFQLTLYFYFHAQNHKFIGRILTFACMPTKNLTFPEAVENISPPCNLKSRNPPLITMILDCIDRRSMDPEWDHSLMVKMVFTNDNMSIFSFNENKRHGEG